MCSKALDNPYPHAPLAIAGMPEPISRAVGKNHDEIMRRLKSFFDIIEMKNPEGMQGKNTGRSLRRPVKIISFYGRAESPED